MFKKVFVFRKKEDFNFQTEFFVKRITSFEKISNKKLMKGKKNKIVQFIQKIFSFSSFVNIVGQ
jgi:hypothetical protein